MKSFKFWDHFYEMIWMTGVTNKHHRLRLREVGREWGEATWTAKDLL